MEILRSWITGITAATLISAVADLITPKSPAGKVVRLAGTLILITAVIAPVKRFDIDFLSPYIVRYNLEFSELSGRITNENKKIQTLIIEDKMSAYILQRAKDIGIVLRRVKVNAGKSAEGYLYPESAELEPEGEISQGKQLELTEIIERECAIPYKRQKFVSSRKGEVQNA